ncbi:MAG TPA: phosphatase PAP2 family protein [Anaeromyxobacteraceae bacterium]|nr:phosphatase PAP2 family protein [Anaeromyxobacteraceae bacterium]
MRPSERLTALALLLLSAVTAASGAAGAGPRLAALAALLAAVLGLARTGARAGPLGLQRDFAPGVVVAAFLLLQPVIEALNPRRYDATFAALDARWLDGLAAAWRGLFGRPAPLTDLLYAAYASFYLLPLSVAAAARLRRGPEAFEQVAFAVLLGFYLSYAGYFLWPTSGPRVPAGEEAARLGGGALSALVRAFLRGAEATTLDAFPSGHTALALVPAALGTRLFPRWGAALWGWAAAVIVATVYISAHYVVDVVAGALLALLTLLAAPAVSRALGAGRRVA